MKWIEIISLRCPGKLKMQFIEELLKNIDQPETPGHLTGIKVYHHSIVETDLSIHIHWKSEGECQGKSPLGLRVSSALKDLGLLNHSVWVETAALEFPLGHPIPTPRETPVPDGKAPPFLQGQKQSERMDF